MKTNIKFLVLFVFSIACLYSCSNDELNDTYVDSFQERVGAISIPPTDQGELAAYLQDLYTAYNGEDEILHYREARVMTYAELMNGLAEVSLPEKVSEFSLSKYPLVIFGSQGLPAYYEFQVFSGGKHIANVASSAMKVSDGVVQYVFAPFEYGDKLVGKKQFANNYPYNRIYQDAEGRFYAFERGELVETNGGIEILSDRQQFDNMLAVMPDSEMVDIKPLLGEVYEQITESEKDASEHWLLLDAAVNDILVSVMGNLNSFYDDSRDADDTWLEDIAIANRIQPIYKGTNESLYEIPAYTDVRLRSTLWAGYCGPSALSFVYRGLYENYPANSQNYINIFGDGSTNYFYQDYSGGKGVWDFDVPTSHCRTFTEAKTEYILRSSAADYGLGACFYQYCSPFGRDNDGDWQMPLFDWGLRKGIRCATNGEYELLFNCVPYKQIRKGNPTVIEINCDHYIVAIACVKVKGNKFFLVTDNGATTSDFAYAPYWRKLNVFNLHYSISKTK